MNKEEIRKALEGKGAVMEIGSPNDGYARFFTGRSWLASLSEDKDIPVYNVTFENGAHTHWHIHHGTSQVLIVVSGKGYLQYEGQAPLRAVISSTFPFPGMEKGYPMNGLSRWTKKDLRNYEME